MTNKIVMAIVGVIILALIIFFATKKQGGDETSEVNNSTTSAETKSEISNETVSMKKLIEGKKDQTCTFSTTEGGAKSDGTVFLSSGKMRGDFSSVISGTTTASHMVYDGTTSYVWMDGQNTGFKMKLDASETQNQQQSIDPNKDFNFSCKNWSVDNSKFNVPGNVQFQDFGTITPPQTNLNGNANIKTTPSAICDQLPEPSKTQCKAAL